jgi:hypothetical protein
MLSPAEIAAIVAATKGTIDILDKIAGQIKSVLTKRPKAADGDDDRWRSRVSPEGDAIVVRQHGRAVQTVAGDQLARVLTRSDLELVLAYERNMNRYFARWKAVYDKRDASQDPLVNAVTEEQLSDQIVKMRAELLGILEFLEKCGVHLDDHYLHVRHLVESARAEAHRAED